MVRFKRSSVRLLPRLSLSSPSVAGEPQIRVPATLRFNFHPAVGINLFQETPTVFGWTGRNILGCPGRGQCVQESSPVFVRVCVGYGVGHPPSSLPRLWSGGLPIVRVAGQLGDASVFFFGEPHDEERS